MRTNCWLLDFISKTRIRVLPMAVPCHQSAPRHELKDRPSDLASNGAGQSSRGIEPGRLLFPVPSPAVAFRSPFSSSPALPPPPHLQIILQRQPGRATATVMAPKRTTTMRNRCQPARTQGPGESARSRSPRVCPYNSRYRRWRGAAPFHRHTASSPARGRGCLVALPAHGHDHLWALTCVAAVCKGRRCHWWVPRWKRGQAAAKRVQSQDRALCTHRRRAWNS